MNYPSMPEEIRAALELAGEAAAKRYAREQGGWPSGFSIAGVNGHTRGWDDCAQAAYALGVAIGEVKYAKEQLELWSGTEDQDHIDYYAAYVKEGEAEVEALLARLRGEEK